MKGKAPTWPVTAVLPPTPVPDPEHPQTPAAWAAWIKDEALRLGFSSAAIAAPGALFSRDSELRAWIDRGNAGPLEYMKRIFPRRDRFLQLMPNLRSILVLTVPYPRVGQSLAADAAGTVNARIARYAAGKDYHRVIQKMLKQLSTSIRRRAGPPTRMLSAVDTSPIPEKTLGEAAGIGFFGKNTCLIQPRGGSYFFLASLLTNLDLSPDPPIRWDCGSCTLCIEACPTGALEKPYQLNADRCISSLTIELKGPIPIPLRPLMKDWLFGCDICQEVCPYNRQPETAVPREELQPKTGAGGRLPLEEILALRTEEDFTQRFAGTPLMRPQRKGLLRNAAVVAANLHCTEFLPALEEASRNDPSEIVREHASWAVQQLKKS